VAWSFYPHPVPCLALPCSRQGKARQGTSLSLEMSDQLVLLQKRALRIIYGGSHFNSNSYASYCAELGIVTLRVRRDLIARRFFHRILEPTSCLHHLIPPKRTCSQTAKFRQSTPYSIPFARSERFRNSFILYSLNNYL